jgi:hypothetical protein
MCDRVGYKINYFEAYSVFQQKSGSIIYVLLEFLVCDRYRL